MNPVPAEVMQQPRDFFVPIATIRDQQQGSLEMAAHLLDKCQDIETLADRLIAALFDIDRYRGTGRLYLP